MTERDEALVGLITEDLRVLASVYRNDPEKLHSKVGARIHQALIEIGAEDIAEQWDQMVKGYEDIAHSHNVILRTMDASIYEAQKVLTNLINQKREFEALEAPVIDDSERTPQST